MPTDSSSVESVECISNDQRERDLPLKHLAHRMTDARRLQCFRDRARFQPLTRSRCRIDTHLQRRNVSLRLGGEVHHSGHL